MLGSLTQTPRFIDEEMRLREEAVLTRSHQFSGTNLFPASHCPDKLKIVTMGQEEVLRSQDCSRMCDKWSLDVIYFLNSTVKLLSGSLADADARD